MSDVRWLQLASSTRPSMTGKLGPPHSIDRVLAAGETFVRVFAEKALPNTIRGLLHIASGRIALIKWGRWLEVVPCLRCVMNSR